MSLSAFDNVRRLRGQTRMSVEDCWGMEGAVLLSRQMALDTQIEETVRGSGRRATVIGSVLREVEAKDSTAARHSWHRVQQCIAPSSVSD